MASMLEKFQAVLMAVMIGDAMGQPVEGMTAADILIATNGLGVRGFIAPIQTTFQHGRQLKAGDTTDDWQLTEVVAQALIAGGGYDQMIMARHHVEAWRQSTIGWGGTTRDAIAAIAEWLDSDGSQGHDPRTLHHFDQPNRGGGNGVTMKISSLALRHTAARGEPGGYINANQLMTEVEQLWRLTHTTPEALYTAFAYAALMAMLLYSGTPYTDSSVMTLLSHTRRMIEQVSRLAPEMDFEVTCRQLQKMESLVGQPKALIEQITPGFSAITSVPFAIGIFASYPRDFRKAVHTCVNAGLDSDTTAAMAGALVSANCGLSVIPNKWRLPHFEQAATSLGAQLYEVARPQP